MMKKVMEYVVTAVVAACIVLALYFATIRTEKQVYVSPTPCNALIETIYYRTDIFGNKTVIDFDIEKLFPDSY